MISFWFWYHSIFYVEWYHSVQVENLYKALKHTNFPIVFIYQYRAFDRQFQKLHHSLGTMHIYKFFFHAFEVHLCAAFHFIFLQISFKSAKMPPGNISLWKFADALPPIWTLVLEYIANTLKCFTFYHSNTIAFSHGVAELLSLRACNRWMRYSPEITSHWFTMINARVFHLGQNYLDFNPLSSAMHADACIDTHYMMRKIEAAILASKQLAIIHNLNLQFYEQLWQYKNGFLHLSHITSKNMPNLGFDRGPGQTSRYMTNDRVPKLEFISHVAKGVLNHKFPLGTK